MTYLSILYGVVIFYSALNFIFLVIVTSIYLKNRKVPIVISKEEYAAHLENQKKWEDKNAKNIH